jgi:hypothetical protein
MSIEHFAFMTGVPTECALFCIPETLELLATAAMANRFRSSSLQGIFLEPLP